MRSPGDIAAGKHCYTMNTFLYNGKPVCYQKEGSGFPVLFLHGFAEDSDVWKHQLSFLQLSATVIIPDLPGSGQSYLLQKEDGSDVTMADYADCIYGLLKHENISRCFVFGHSMGGYITLALAEKYPEVIQGFGFIQSTAFADSEEKKAMRLKGIGTISQYGSYAFIKSTTPNLFSDEYKATRGDEIESLINKGKNFSKPALQQYYNAMRLREDKTAVLKNSTVPVLFIIGKEDKAAPLADLLKQVYLPSVSYLHILEVAGHMGMWERADEVNGHLLAFIKDNSLVVA